MVAIEKLPPHSLGMGWFMLRGILDKIAERCK